MGFEMIMEHISRSDFNYGEFALNKDQAIGLQAKTGLKELSYDA